MNPKQMAEMLGRHGKGLKEAGKKAALSAAMRGANTLARKGPKDRGELARSWKAKATSNGAILGSDAPHAAIVEFGAKPHPVSAMGRASLAGWVKRRNPGISDDEAIARGHAIANKIEKEGQEATHFVRDSIERLEAQFSEEFHRELDKLLGKGP